MKWDPYQYALFSEQRSRPFYDLFTRLSEFAPATLVDLGCGSGELTRLFLKRWRNSRILGVDSSQEMLQIAGAYAVPGRLAFQVGDIATWIAEEPIDLLFSNAALQWVADHAALIPRLAAAVAPGGTFAVQMPANYDEPSHQAIRELLAEPRWRDRLNDLPDRMSPVQPLAWYVARLLELGFQVDGWETRYLHVLQGTDPVLEWLKGTALRPVLSQLAEEETRELIQALGARLRVHYPAGAHGTLLPFQRMFFIATRR